MEHGEKYQGRFWHLLKFVNVVLLFCFLVPSRTRQVSQYLKQGKNGNNHWNLNPTELTIDEWDNGLLAQALRAMRFRMRPAL